MKVKSPLATLLLACLLISNAGCPTSLTSQATFENLVIDFTYDLKGLCIIWFRDVVILNPHIIYIVIPHLTTFSWVPGVIGAFGINNDQKGTDEFKFNVVSNGSFGFIDFDSSNTFTPGDIRIDWNPSLTRFEVMHPFGGLGVAPGFYYLMFLPGLLPITGHDPCWDITVEMIGQPSPLIPEGLTIRRNRVLCMNSCIMPHMGFASLASLVVNTDFVLYNVNPVSNTITVHFYNQDGTPAEVTINGTTASEHSFNLDANTSLRVRPSVDPGASGVKVLWALGFGVWPIACALDFASFDGLLPSPAGAAPASDLLGQAGIAASGVDRLHVLNIVRKSDPNPALAINTALAIVNPTQGDATIQARLLDENDVEVRSATLEVLAGRHQRPYFFASLFDDFDPPDFNGTLILSSDTDVGVATLETDGGGLQQASLPSANRNTP